MKLRSLTSRRPSPALVVASAALVCSLGGVGYAATGLPSGSVGSSQIRDGAVTYQKVAPNSIGSVRLANGGVTNSKLAEGSVSYKNIAQGAVGTKRANLSQLQARVFKTCAAGSAIGAVSSSGTPTCNATLPAEYGATDATVALSATAATTATKALPAGADYLAFADTELTATSGTAAVKVTVSCTLTVGSTTQTRNVVLTTNGVAGNVSNAQLPMQVAGSSGAATQACTATAPAAPAGQTLPTVTSTAGVNAVQTVSNN